MNESDRNPARPENTPTRAGPAPAEVTVHLSTSDLQGSSLGRYEISREIGRGGMGVVYEARDSQLERSGTRWGLVGALLHRAVLHRDAGRTAEAEADRARTRFLAEECGAAFEVLDGLG